jgi:hypothetical protein
MKKNFTPTIYKQFALVLLLLGLFSHSSIAQDITLTSPADNYQADSNNILFSWSPDAETSYDVYRLEVYERVGLGFETVFDDTTPLTSLNVRIPLTNRDLIWQVRGESADGSTTGPYSGIRDFNSFIPEYLASDNDNGFAGGVIGKSGMDWELNGSTVTATLYAEADLLDDALVLYLDTGLDGRNVIGSDVNDQADKYRRAISSAGANASELTFYSGFEASHAIVIEKDKSTLYEIPATGSIGDGDLIERYDVINGGFDLSQNNIVFEFNLNTMAESGDAVSEINFVGVYVDPDNGNTSNEGYGATFPANDIGSGDYTFGELTPAQTVFNAPVETRTLNEAQGWYLLSPMTPSNLNNLAVQNLVQGISDGPFPNQDPNIFVGYVGAEIDSDGDINNPADPRLVNGWVVPDFMDRESVPGQGFLWYIFSTPEANLNPDFGLPFDLTQVGEAFSGTINFPIHDDGDLINIIGNPFDEALPSANISSVGGNTQRDFRTYNPTDGWTMPDDFDVMDGIAVTNNDADQVRFFDPSSTGSRPAQPSLERLLSFKLSSERSTSEETIEIADNSILLLFNEEATRGWDLWDAKEFMPYRNYFAIGSFEGERDGKPVSQARVSLPYDISEPVSLPLSLNAVGVENDMELSVSAFENFPSDWSLELHDLATGEVIALNADASYQFSMDVPELSTKNELSIQELGKIRVAKSADFESRFEVIVTPGTATSTPVSGELPERLALHQNYPNPFNPTTQINYELPETADVRLDVFNVQGQRVATLVNSSQSAGSYNVNFDASNLASGVYLYRLQSGAEVITRTMTLIK